jgi:hypothetical protein
MTDILFIYWMIAGTLLSFILLAITKQPMLSAIVGFLMGPVLPAVLLYAAISTYVESRE